MLCSLVIVVTFAAFLSSGNCTGEPLPEFKGPVANITVPLGKEAILVCSIQNLGHYKVGWLRLEDGALLTLHDRVITYNSRIRVSVEGDTWTLHVRRLSRADLGCYMCQINTNTMMHRVGCIGAFVSPDIVDEKTSSDMEVREGDNVTLSCSASGHPPPNITWKRFDGTPMRIGPRHHKVLVSKGESLRFFEVDRSQSGRYLCIASNDVPPTISKTINLDIKYVPSVRLAKVKVGSPVGEDTSLTCRIHSNPPSNNYWITNRGVVVSTSAKYDLEETRLPSGVVELRLEVRQFQPSDVGSYLCVAFNELGKAEAHASIFELKTQNQNADEDLDYEEYYEEDRVSQESVAKMKSTQIHKASNTTSSLTSNSFQYTNYAFINKPPSFPIWFITMYLTIVHYCI